MSVSEPFIRRPIATSLLGIALMIGGALGYWALPVSALPQVDFPTVQVTTQLPGASPDAKAGKEGGPGKEGEAKDGEHRGKRERGEGDQKGQTGPAPAEPSSGSGGAAKSRP